jgi:hypothetical protein
MNASQPNVKPDELDALLHAFFRAEMPNPWPQLKAPVPASLDETTKAPPSSWSRSRSRFALAASVALLMLTSWWLSGRTVEYSNSGFDSGPPKAGKSIRDKIVEDVKAKERLKADGGGPNQ